MVRQIISNVKNTSLIKKHKKRKFDEITKKKYKVSESESEESEVESSLNGENEDVSSIGNHIYFKTDINDKSVEKLIELIDTKNNNFKKLVRNKMIKSAKPNPIYLHINSPGGQIFPSFRAVDAIKRSTIPVYTVVDGYAASGATLMSVVGKKRFMTPNSYMLIHQLSSGAIGKWIEIQDDYKNCNTLMEDIYTLYLDHCSMDRKELEDYLSHDLLWKIDRCLETGLVDEPYTESPDD